jgi:hypothetical protein
MMGNGLRAFRKLRIRLPPILAHGVGPHLNAVGVVHQPVEDAISRRGIADLFMPAVTRNCEVRISERT